MVEEDKEMVKNNPVQTKIKIQKSDVVQYNRNWLKIVHANRQYDTQTQDGSRWERAEATAYTRSRSIDC